MIINIGAEANGEIIRISIKIGLETIVSKATVLIVKLVPETTHHSGIIDIDFMREIILVRMIMAIEIKIRWTSITMVTKITIMTHVHKQMVEVAAMGMLQPVKINLTSR